MARVHQVQLGEQAYEERTRAQKLPSLFCLPSTCVAFKGITGTSFQEPFTSGLPLQHGNLAPLTPRVIPEPHKFDRVTCQVLRRSQVVPCNRKDDHTTCIFFASRHSLIFFPTHPHLEHRRAKNVLVIATNELAKGDHAITN
jgi:hypothetical protein